MINLWIVPSDLMGSIMLLTLNTATAEAFIALREKYEKQKHFPLYMFHTLKAYL